MLDKLKKLCSHLKLSSTCCSNNQFVQDGQLVCRLYRCNSCEKLVERCGIHPDHIDIENTSSLCLKCFQHLEPLKPNEIYLVD
jgi:hypothetical protein